MSEKIKIVLKTISSTTKAFTQQPESTQPTKIKLKPKEIVPDPPQLNLESLDHQDYLQHFFIKPLKKLIKNEGVHDGALIAQVCALEIMERMFNSLLIRDNTSITDILYEAAFADYQVEEISSSIEEEIEEEVVDSSEEEEEEVDDSSEEEEEVDDDDEEIEDDEDEDEQDYEYDLEEAREFDSYVGGYSEDESMDG